MIARPSFFSLQPTESDAGKEVYVDVVEKRGTFKGGIHDRNILGKITTFGIVKFPQCHSVSVFPLDEIELVPETEKATESTAASQLNTQGEYSMLVLTSEEFDIQSEIAKYEEQIQALQSQSTKKMSDALKKRRLLDIKLLSGTLDGLRDCLKFPRGSRIVHAHYGEGTALSAFVDERDCAMVSVRFDGGLCKDFAPNELKLAEVQEVQEVPAAIESFLDRCSAKPDDSEAIAKLAEVIVGSDNLPEIPAPVEIVDRTEEVKAPELTKAELLDPTPEQQTQLNEFAPSLPVQPTALSLAEIRRDGGTQSREKLDLSHVATLREALADGVELDPVTVIYDGTDYWLGDGFHRCKAYEESGVEDILAIVIPGTRRDAVLFSVGANGDHKAVKLRTPEDKRRAVMTLLNDPEWKQWSDREIARACKVAHSFVSKLRKQESTSTGFESSCESSQPVERTYRKNGTTATMRTGNIGRKSQPATTEQETVAAGQSLGLPGSGGQQLPDAPVNSDIPLHPVKSLEDCMTMKDVIEAIAGSPKSALTEFYHADWQERWRLRGLCPDIGTRLRVMESDELQVGAMMSALEIADRDSKIGWLESQIGIASVTGTPVNPAPAEDYLIGFLSNIENLSPEQLREAQYRIQQKLGTSDGKVEQLKSELQQRDGIVEQYYQELCNVREERDKLAARVTKLEAELKRVAVTEAA